MEIDGNRDRKIGTAVHPRETVISEDTTNFQLQPQGRTRRIPPKREAFRVALFRSFVRFKGCLLYLPERNTAATFTVNPRVACRQA